MKNPRLRARPVSALAMLLGASLSSALPAFTASAHGARASHAMPAASAPIGSPGNPARVTRTIDIDMRDTMRFTPARTPKAEYRLPLAHRLIFPAQAIHPHRGNGYRLPRGKNAPQ